MLLQGLLHFTSIDLRLWIVINTLGANSRTAPFLLLVEGTGLMVELRSWVSNANVAGSSLYSGEYVLKPLLDLKQSFIQK